ncbi:MAG: Fe-S protein assembly co-chaperone HscB [Alphaproteobacteria bacterium]|nr:Fe-S protein assembly co-chaperone HscB [Alphaproteobacteria bacterium]
MNYFELLNLPTTFTLDLTALEAAYFSAQRRYHPDRFVGKPAEEKLKAAQISANLNDAYHTLKHPLSRARHLLALSGITVLDEANSAKPDKALLMEIMELQEAIAEGGKPNIAALINACEKDLSEAFRNNDLDEAKASTIRLSYLYKLHQTH